MRFADCARRAPRLLAQLIAAGIAASASADPACAADGFHPLDSALEMMNLKADPGSMPDFVQQSRPAAKTDDYLPVGVKPPPRSIKPKSAADVKALTAELDAARAAQLAGKRPKPPGKPARPAVATPKPKQTATDH